MKHALLGPSAAPRWTRCTRSARASEHAPDRTSIHADRGSFGHAMVEECLKKGLIPDQLCGRPQWEGSEFFDADARDLALFCVEYALDKINAARQISKDPEIRIEQRLDLAKWVPGSFGTADLIIVVDGHLWVIDWKMGSGVKVYAEENEQALLYGLGAYDIVGHLYDVEEAHLVIVQPALDHVDEWTVPVDRLIKFGEWVKPLAQQAWDGTGDFVPGPKQCQWCRIKATCKARAAANLAIADAKIEQDVHQLSLVEVSELLPKLAEIATWAKDVQEYAFKEATEGKKVPGYKLVRGRSDRFIAAPDLARQVLNNSGFPDEKIFKPAALLGITALEKVVGGAKKFNALLADCVEKPIGSPVLVPLADKRNEIPTGVVTDSDFDDA